jgi:hypothetical protein
MIFSFGLTQLGMLWWLAAAAAPLLIHLLFRRRYREVPWAAVAFLLAALQKSSRRLRAEQWILLAVRTAIIICVVMAVAGPYWELLNGAPAIGQPAHKILVIDGSYSMGYKPAEKTRFELAKQFAREIIGRSSPGDGFSLVLMSAPPRVIVGTPTYVSDEARAALAQIAGATAGVDTSDVRRKADDDELVKDIRDLELPHGGGNLAETLNRVEDLIARTRREAPRLATTEVYFLTDLGRTTWDLSSLAGGAQIRDKLTNLTESTRVEVIDLGQDHSENAAIVGLKSTQQVYTTGGPVVFQADVRNFGTQTHHLQIELLVDGQRFQQRTLDIAAGGQQTVPFSHRFEAPGEHSVEARLSGDPLDRLDIDDHRWLAVPVRQAIEALIVNGEGSREQARYLFNALDPYRDGSEPLPVHVEEMSDGRLLETDLRRFDCVLLSNVAQFTPAEARILANYATGGGGLIFFLGDRVDAGNYNQELGGGRPGAPHLLPAKLAGPANAGQYRFDPRGYNDPVVREFQGNQNAGLLNTAISRYFKIERPQSRDDTRVALGIGETGDPAIVAAPIHGEGSNDRGGTSIVVALPASFASIDPVSRAPWSNWPMKYSFPPVMQNLLLAAIGPQGADRNLLVGRTIESSVPGGQYGGSVMVERPDRRKEQIRLAARSGGDRWSYADTWRSGVYRAEFGSSGDARLFAVNVDSRESDLAKVSAAALPEQLSVVEGASSIEHRPLVELGARVEGQRWFLYAALGLLLLETTLAWYFGYRSS